MNQGFPPHFDGPLHQQLHQRVTTEIALRVIRAANENGGSTAFTEATLCRQLGVGRSVVREAIKVLAAKGLVAVRKKQGMRVRPRHHWQLSDPDVLRWLGKAGPNLRLIVDLYEIRAILEPAAAELTAMRATSEHIAAIEAAYRQMACANGRNKKYITADVEFHYSILSGVGNDLLSYVARTTICEALRYSFEFGSKACPSAIELDLKLHRAVAEAIANRDAKAARTATIRLVETSRASLSKTLKGKKSLMT